MFDSTPSYCISLDNDNTFYPCPHFTSPSIMEFEAMAFHIGSIVLNIFHTSTMLPHLLYTSWSYYLHRHLIHVTTLRDLHMDGLSYSSVGKLAHEMNIQTNVNLFGTMPFYCICWKISIVFLYNPNFLLLTSLVLQEKLFNCIVTSAMATNLISTHGRIKLLLNYNIFCFLYVWNWDTLHSPMFSTNQPCISGNLLQANPKP